MKQKLFTILVFSIISTWCITLLLSFWKGIFINEKKLENMGISEYTAAASETDNINADKSEKMKLQLNSFFESPEVVCQTNEKYETLRKTVDNYVQRYISLFLITSNLLNHEVQDLNEMIVIDLEISISGQDLAYLQNHSKSLKDLSYQKDLSKLDAIFSKIARLKEKSYKEKAMRSIMSLLTNFIFSLLSSYHFYRFLSFLSILISIWISRYYLFTKSFYIFLVVLINSIIIWEGLNLYSKKIKDMDIEIYVQTLQFKGVPEECDPTNVRWYHGIVNLFRKDKCLQYFETLHKNAVEEVSLFKCILDMYALYIIRTPIRIYGMTIRDLTDELFAACPWPLKYILNIPLVFLLALAGGTFILILYGKRFKLSFFGTTMEIGDIKTVPEKQMIDNFNTEKPKEFRVIRKLKPWTKSRFSKRLESDFGRRRKLFLKSSKSRVEMPESAEKLMSYSDESASSLNGCNEASINSEMTNN